MTTDPVAGPSYVNSHVLPMTSQLHLYSSSQQLHPAAAAVCLPVSIQQLTYDDGDFHGDSDNDRDDTDGVVADGNVALKVSSAANP